MIPYCPAVALLPDTVIAAVKAQPGVVSAAGWGVGGGAVGVSPGSGVGWVMGGSVAGMLRMLLRET